MKRKQVGTGISGFDDIILFRFLPTVMSSKKRKGKKEEEKKILADCDCLRDAQKASKRLSSKRGEVLGEPSPPAPAAPAAAAPPVRLPYVL